ncbi:MAG: response regulator [Desulfamplus sp.]|nr:response regulator [Desulfamplus sp.]
MNEKIPTKTAKILIVEDERVVAMSIEDALIGMGHTVCGIASSGEQARLLSASNNPDLVMMDIKLKGAADGIETAKKLKELYDIPVIFLTAYSDQQILERAKLVEPLGYILKPCKVDVLKSVVEIALYKAEMEKKLQQINHQLEESVKKRTKELTDEIAHRKETEQTLREKTHFLKESNEALSSMIKTREAEKRAIEEEILLNIKKYVLPYIELIDQENPTDKLLAVTAMLRKTLNELVSPASKTLFAKYINLTPHEIKIAELIRDGKSTKEIASLVNIAPSSVSTYRNHIRKKMGLLNSRVNLETYLKSLA